MCSFYTIQQGRESTVDLKGNLTYRPKIIVGSVPGGGGVFHRKRDVDRPKTSVGERVARGVNSSERKYRTQRLSSALYIKFAQ